MVRTDKRLKAQEEAAREAEKDLEGTGSASATLPIVLMSDTAKKPAIIKLLLAFCALSKAVTQVSSHLGIDLSCATGATQLQQHRVLNLIR